MVHSGHSSTRILRIVSIMLPVFLLVLPLQAQQPDTPVERIRLDIPGPPAAADGSALPALMVTYTSPATGIPRGVPDTFRRGELEEPEHDTPLRNPHALSLPGSYRVLARNPGYRHPARHGNYHPLCGRSRKGGCPDSRGRGHHDRVWPRALAEGGL